MTQTQILIVDDERFFRESIAEILQQRGFDCELCEDGETAIEVADPARHAAVVLDIRLPGMDGIEVLRTLREQHPALQIIMLSASTDQELVLDALRLGACDYLAKPLHDEELILAVRRACTSHEIMSHWDGLRSRVVRLCEWWDEVGERASQEGDDDREVLLHREAVELAAEVLDAGRTSLMRLDEEEQRMRVVASVGHQLDPQQMDEVEVGRGVSGRVVEERQPLLVEDANADDRIATDPDPDRYLTDSFVVVPVIASGRRFGVLCATDRMDGGSFGREDLALLRLLAARIAELLASDEPAARDDEPPATASVESELELDDDSAATVVEMTRETMPLDLAREVADAVSVCADAGDRDAEIAREICEAITNEVDAERVIKAVLRPVERGLKAEGVAIYLGSPEAGVLNLEANSEGALRVDRAELAVGRGLTGAVLQTGQLVATDDPSADPRFDDEVDTPSDGKPGPLLCFPLKLRGKTVGLGRVHLPQGAQVSARTGEVLVSVMSAAIRNVFLYRSLIESIEEVATVRRESRR